MRSYSHDLDAIMRAMRGIHHVTAISGPAQRNVDFYVGLLGLRLVKKTVNFDDPGTYHLYYGDASGRPGTILTFFPWEHAVPGRAGSGMTSAAALSIPEGSLEFWMERLTGAAVEFDGPRERFGEGTIGFNDPDGMRLELVAHAVSGDGWDGGPVPAEHGLRSFHSITLALADPDETARVLTEIFGYEKGEEEQGRRRFRSASGDYAAVVDLARDESRGRMGAGCVHHVAFRARDEDDQRMWRDAIVDFGLAVTDVKDRSYFRSIYFREPGGVLFEIATDSPGFTVDERPEALGTHLMLPEWLEPRRDRLEARLPELHLPNRSA